MSLELIFFVPTAQAQDRCARYSMYFLLLSLPELLLWANKFEFQILKLQKMVQICFVLSVVGRKQNIEANAHLVTIVMSSFFFFFVSGTGRIGWSGGKEGEGERRESLE